MTTTDSKEREALRTIAEWPITKAGQFDAMDAVNMAAVAKEALSSLAESAGSEPVAGEWIALPGALPEPGTPVLLDIGKKYPIRAVWTAAFENDADWGEYDEATDTYYCPEGWYEWNEQEEIHWAVSTTPRAWTPLPTTSSADSRKGE